MLNLFEKDMAAVLATETKNLQHYFQSRLEESCEVPVDKKLQLKINQWQNLQGYQMRVGGAIRAF